MNGGTFRIGAGGAWRHLLTLGLLRVDAADGSDRFEPRLVGAATIGGIGGARPYVRGGVVVGHYVMQHPPVEAGTVNDLAKWGEGVAPADRDAAFVAKARNGDADHLAAPVLRELQSLAYVGALLRAFGRIL